MGIITKLWFESESEPIPDPEPVQDLEPDLGSLFSSSNLRIRVLLEPIADPGPFPNPELVPDPEPVLDLEPVGAVSGTLTFLSTSEGPDPH
jgi:hypothetical protein